MSLLLATINDAMDAQILHPELTDLTLPGVQDWVVAYSLGSFCSLYDVTRSPTEQIKAMGQIFIDNLEHLVDFKEMQTTEATSKIIAMQLLGSFDDDNSLINALGSVFRAHLEHLLRLTYAQSAESVSKIVAVLVQDGCEDHVLYRFVAAGGDNTNKMGTPEYGNDNLFEMITAEQNKNLPKE